LLEKCRDSSLVKIVDALAVVRSTQVSKLVITSDPIIFTHSLYPFEKLVSNYPVSSPIRLSSFLLHRSRSPHLLVSTPVTPLVAAYYYVDHHHCSGQSIVEIGS
jgi:hypothetical protein